MTPKFSTSLIDSFLSDTREIDWKELGLKDAVSSAEEWHDRAGAEVNSDFLDDLISGSIKQVDVMSTSKDASFRQRMLDKENASPRMGMGRAASTRTSGDTSEDDSLVGEITHSIEEAAKGGTVEKKNVTDSEIQNYIKRLLNQGDTPAKVASQLDKIAEIEQFNVQAAQSYLNSAAGLIGLAYLEPNAKNADLEVFNKSMGNGYLNNSDSGGTGMPTLQTNTFMDKQNPNYNHTASSPTGQDCIRQANAWKAAGITPRAKSVKQVAACQECSYYKKSGSSKSCGLYGLPIVGSSAELTSIVNKMTAGVPAKSKRAALVQIANRLSEQNIPVKASNSEAPFQRQSAFTKERDYDITSPDHFSGVNVEKMHIAGHSLKNIATAAEKKFGALEASKAIREFVASLHMEKGKIIMAKADAEFLKGIGIRNEAIVASAKCASCKEHSTKETHKAASTSMVTRAPEKFVQATLNTVRLEQKKVVAHFDSEKVGKLHSAGYPLEQIVKAASARYGSAQTSKAVKDWSQNLKNTNTKIALSQVDCTVLAKMGVKLGSQNAIIGAEKCGSCSFRNGMHCGLTGGTLLSFPGMTQITSNKKVAAGAPEDGRAILNEYDLMGSKPQDDIDMSDPDRADIQMAAIMNAGDI